MTNDRHIAEESVEENPLEEILGTIQHYDRDLTLQVRDALRVVINHSETGEIDFGPQFDDHIHQAKSELDKAIEELP